MTVFREIKKSSDTLCYEARIKRLKKEYVLVNKTKSTGNCIWRKKLEVVVAAVAIVAYYDRVSEKKAFIQQNISRRPSSSYHVTCTPLVPFSVNRHFFLCFFYLA